MNAIISMMDKFIMENIDIDLFLKDRKLNLIRLSKDRNDKNKLIGLPDMLPKPNDKQENDINNDIKILEKMLQAIIDFDNNRSNLKQTLITIGSCAGEISFNDNGDKENRYIRNRYGYIQRNQNKSINKNGIYFERLYQLMIILSNDQMSSSIPVRELDDLATNLSSLKEKIISVFRYQKSANNIKFDCSLSISVLTNFAKTYYEQMLLKRIDCEFDKLEDIDFSVKGDRYYFARAFCIIGELFKEFLEDQSKQERERLLMTTFKNFSKLRDQLIHYHDKVKSGLGSQNQSINEIIIEIKHHLKQVIVKNGNSEDHLKIDFSYADSTKFNELINRFSCILMGKSIKANTEKKCKARAQRKNKKLEKHETDEEIRNKLNRLVSRACGIIEGINSGVIERETNIHSIEDRLSSLNTNYQSYLNKLDINDRSYYPEVLDLTNKIFIKKFDDNIAKSSTKSSDSSMKKVGDFFLKIQTMKDEVEYLLDLRKSWSNEEIKINEKKRRYIIQYIMGVIGQLVRDIEGLDICKLSTVENSSESSDYLLKLVHFDKFSSSILIREGEILSKQLRNRGLAHNILCFDEDRFFEGLKEVESSHSQFDLYFNIITKDNLPKSAEMMKFVGLSLFHIGLYEEANDYLEKAVDLYKEYPCKNENIEFSKFSTVEFKEVVHMDPMIFEIYQEFLMNYSRSGNLEKDLNIGRSLLFQLNTVRQEHIFYPLMLANIQFVLKTYIKPCKKLEDINKILKFHKIMNTICFHFTIILYSLLFFVCYSRDSSLTEQFKKHFETEKECTQKFRAMKFYVYSCLEFHYDETRNSEIHANIDTMEVLFHENLNDFKTILGDKYLIEKICIIVLRLKLIIKSDLRNSNIINEIRHLSNQLKEIINKSDNVFKDYPINVDTYYRLAIEFLNINVINIVPELSEESLKEAEYYFDLAVDSFERFPLTLYHFRTEITNLGNLLFKIIDLSSDTSEKCSRMKFKMDYLHEILYFQENCVLEEITLLNDSGHKFYLLGEKYFIEYFDGDIHETAALALDNYDKAIKYYNVFLNLIREKKNFPHSIIDTKIKLANCHSSMALLRYELKLLATCKYYWNELLAFPLDEKDEVFVNECKESNEYNLSLITAVLNQIVNHNLPNNELQFDDQYIVMFLKNKFNIEIINENDTKKWIYRGELSMDELEIKIIKELQDSYD